MAVPASDEPLLAPELLLEPELLPELPDEAMPLEAPLDPEVPPELGAELELPPEVLAPLPPPEGESPLASSPLPALLDDPDVPPACVPDPELLA